MEPITVLIVDDHLPFRAGLCALLESVLTLTVVGDVGSGDEAILLAAKFQPDVILMDIQMSAINGIEATRRILATSPHIAILILTMFEDDDFVFSIDDLLSGKLDKRLLQYRQIGVTRLDEIKKAAIAFSRKQGL